MKWLMLAFLTLLFLFCISTTGYAVDCDSCSDCSSKIQSASSGEVVNLITDISTDTSCIDIRDVSGVIFNCNSHVIDGNGNIATGIYFNYTGGSHNVVRNCRIQNFSTGILVATSHNIIDNVVSSGNPSSGIYIRQLSGTVLVENNTIRNSVFSFNTYITGDGYGIAVFGTPAYNKFINVTSSSNKRGLVLGSNSDSNTFTDLVIDSNTEYGIEIFRSDSNIINYSRIENNSIGIWIRNSDSNLIYNNYFNNTDNTNIESGLNDWNITKTPGPSIIGENYLGGNFWSDYSGQDLDGDGIGDSPHYLGLNDYDYLPLAHLSFLISIVPPTPENESILSENWIFVNASANDVLDTCLLEWNDVNESIPVSGKFCYKNKTDLSNGDYSFRVWGNNSFGNSSVSLKRFVTINSTIPDILYAIQPRLVVNGSNVSLMINASHPFGIDKTWLTITLPDSTSQIIDLQNGVAINYTTTSLIGRYNITFFANDTLGNEGNVSDYFDAQESVVTMNFIVNVINNTGGGIVCNLTVYDAGTPDVVAEYQAGDGRFDEDLVEGMYDFLFNAYNGDLQVLLTGISLSQNTNRSIGLDKPYQASGFVHTYAVESNYTISNARVRIAYTESLFSNESYMGVYICENWNFSQRSCTGSWNKTITIQNQTQNYLDVYVSSFSAFSIKQESYCGDGVCSSEEDASSCPVDCECDLNEVRPCNVTHQGVCGVGDEMCVDGSWTGCPSPVTETCNGEDDDCDGVIDDVLGGTSVESAQCGCYGGADPQDEICNGIDDDCDGDIDEEGDCCINNQTRECGPGNETGVCQKGISTCINNVWGSCENATYAINEICGNDLDDDCDGETDEDCGWGLGLDLGLVLILVGVIILIVIVILYLHFRSKGKELTWEELKKRWTPAYQ